MRSPARRRFLAVAAAGLAGFAALGVYQLAGSGSAGLTITPPAGVTSGTGGAPVVVDGTGLSGSITQSHGSAQLDSGVPVTKLVVASGFEDALRVSVTWTNAVDAGTFLHGNDQISVGFWHPVAVPNGGSCTTSGTLKVTDSTATAGSVCVAKDNAVTASGGVLDTSTHTLFISPSQIGGAAKPAAAAPSSPATCAADNGSATTWCTPAGSTVGSSQVVVYVLASVLNPANHNPHGQQPTSGQLSFFVQAKAVS